MFTVGDVRDVLLKAGVPEDRARKVLADVTGSAEDDQYFAHDCEGRLCTVCAEWRARHGNRPL